MKKNTATVVKANNVIEAKYRLSTREQKVLLLFISMLKPSHQRGHVYTTHVNEIMEVLNTSDTKWGDAYTSFKEIVTSLKSKPLHLENDEEVIICNWLGAVSLIKKSGEIKFAFEPQLEPFLFEVKKNFTMYPLHNIVRLKSSFSIRVYELLKQYALIGKRRFELQQLRGMLGIQDALYSRYFDFKKRVLLTAQKELAKKTDISFTFKEEKKGRRIAYLTFYINQNESKGAVEGEQVYELSLEEEPQNTGGQQLSLEYDKEQRLRERLLELQLDEWQVNRVVERVGVNGESGIWKLINEIKMDKRDGKVKGGIAGYTAKLLDKRYKLGFFKAAEEALS
ncbi:replication initiation protein [Rapidithrix thailandica]|uniref:Replication initiation protein n=1 Tax=Rapidithrix thailandica TaxID=413964 RepID=A0AAW9SBW1_9BACT